MNLNKHRNVLLRGRADCQSHTEVQHSKGPKVDVDIKPSVGNTLFSYRATVEYIMKHVKSSLIKQK